MVIEKTVTLVWRNKKGTTSTGKLLEKESLDLNKGVSTGLFVVKNGEDIFLVRNADIVSLTTVTIETWLR